MTIQNPSGSLKFEYRWLFKVGSNYGLLLCSSRTAAMGMREVLNPQYARTAILQHRSTGGRWVEIDVETGAVMGRSTALTAGRTGTRSAPAKRAGTGTKRRTTAGVR